MKLIANKSFLNLKQDDTFCIDNEQARVLDIKTGGNGRIVIVELQREDQKEANYTLNQHLAIKSINTDHISANTLQLFKEEISIWSRFTCPQIVPLLGILEDEKNNWYTCMPTFNQNLTEFINELDPNEKTHLLLFQILTDIAYALIEAKSKNIVHLDLKPNNILVKNPIQLVQNQLKEGTYKSFCVSDWGISCIINDCDEHELIIKNMYNGTIPFMSPERLNFEKKKIDHKSDIFAFGMIAYEITLGSLPFSYSCKGVRDIVNEIRSGKYFINMQLMLHQRKINSDLSELILKMTNPDPSKRPDIFEAVPIIVKTFSGKKSLNEPINKHDLFLKLNQKSKDKNNVNKIYKKSFISSLFSLAQDVARTERFGFSDQPYYRLLKKGLEEKLLPKINFNFDKLINLGSKIEFLRIYENSLVINSFREYNQREKDVFSDQICSISGIKSENLNNIDEFEFNTALFTFLIANKIIPDLVDQYNFRFHLIWENLLVPLPLYITCFIFLNGQKLLPDHEDISEFESIWGKISLFNDYLNKELYYYILENYKGSKAKSFVELPKESQLMLNMHPSLAPPAKYSIILYHLVKKEFKVFSVYENGKTNPIRLVSSWPRESGDLQAFGLHANVIQDILNKSEISASEVVNHLAQNLL